MEVDVFEVNVCEAGSYLIVKPHPLPGKAVIRSAGMMVLGAKNGSNPATRA